MTCIPERTRAREALSAGMPDPTGPLGSSQERRPTAEPSSEPRRAYEERALVSVVRRLAECVCRRTYEGMKRTARSERWKTGHTQRMQPRRTLPLALPRVSALVLPRQAHMRSQVVPSSWTDSATAADCHWSDGIDALSRQGQLSQVSIVAQEQETSYSFQQPSNRQSLTWGLDSCEVEQLPSCNALGGVSNILGCCQAGEDPCLV